VENQVSEKAFTIQQIGPRDSPERKRADEIYEGIIVPAVEETGLEPYRADLDLTPGAITPKMLSELLGARVVIADLTGRNANVFYELGITHSFARPLISIAESSSALPFDAKDERVIELGECPPSGLGFRQGQLAIASLRQSLEIVLAESYVPRSPLREVAANRSVDQLAPDNPLAAEMAQMREALDQIRQKITLDLSERNTAAYDASPSAERNSLDRRISDLRAFEREYRSRLIAYLEGQLRELESITPNKELPEKDELVKRIDFLRRFEREYHGRLKDYLEGQLRDLKAP
jgi:hypothetical protein